MGKRCQTLIDQSKKTDNLTDGESIGTHQHVDRLNVAVFGDKGLKEEGLAQKLSQLETQISENETGKIQKRLDAVTYERVILGLGLVISVLFNIYNISNRSNHSLERPH